MRTKVTLTVEPHRGAQSFELIAQEIGPDDKLWPLWRIQWDAMVPTNITPGQLLHHVQQVLYIAYSRAAAELHESDRHKPLGL